MIVAQEVTVTAAVPARSRYKYPPRRGAMVASFFYIYYPIDRIVHQIVPFLDPWVLSIERLVYCYCVAEHGERLIGKHANLVLLPLAGYVCGMYEFRVTPWPLVNFAVTMAIFGVYVPIGSHDPRVFIGTALAYVFIKNRSLPTLYDIHFFAIVSLFTLVLFIVAFAAAFKEDYEGTTAYLLFFHYMVAYITGASNVIDEQDMWMHWCIRKVMSRVSILMWWVMVSTVFYLTFGIRIYYAVMGGGSQKLK
jgi:hypothetical protein